MTGWDAPVTDPFVIDLEERWSWRAHMYRALQQLLLAAEYSEPPAYAVDAVRSAGRHLRTAVARLGLPEDTGPFPVSSDGPSNLFHALAEVSAAVADWEDGTCGDIVLVHRLSHTEAVLRQWWEANHG